MSRTGKKPVAPVSGVTVTINGRTVSAKGPKGELSIELMDAVNAEQGDDGISITPANDTKFARAAWGTTRALIQNDSPIVGVYGLNARGSGDMYPKGGNMLHTIRHVIGDDARWNQILRGLNTEFRHRIVTGRQVQAYIAAQAGIPLEKVFDQYLTTTKIPAFEYRLDGSKLSYRWADVVPGFAMPVDVRVCGDTTVRLAPTASWQAAVLPLRHPEDFAVDPNFYVIPRRAD